jgi:transposase
LEVLTQTAVALGVPISPQGWDQRFTKEASDFLVSVLEQAVHEKVEAEPVGVEVLSRFRGVYLLDASQVILPAELSEVWRGNGRKKPKVGTEAAVKLSVGFDLCRGVLLGPELTDGKEHDSNADLVAAVLPSGSLRITDLGYFKLWTLARLDRLSGYWLSRYPTKCGFWDADGHAWERDAFLAGQTGDRLDLPLQLGLKERLPCRLLAVRVPPEVKKAEETVDVIPDVEGKPGPPRKRPEKLHADKAYDSRKLRDALRERHILPRIARRGIESSTTLGRYRWVVERTLSGLNRFRRLKVRYERRSDIHRAFLHLAASLICLHFLF